MVAASLTAAQHSSISAAPNRNKGINGIKIDPAGVDFPELIDVCYNCTLRYKELWVSYLTRPPALGCWA
jgi:hypothetical protein